MTKSDNERFFHTGTPEEIRAGQYSADPLTFDEILDNLEDGLILRELARDGYGKVITDKDVAPANEYICYDGGLVFLRSGIDSRLARLIAHDVQHKLDLSETDTDPTEPEV